MVRVFLLALLLAVSTLVGSTSRAVDGVHEINQTKALAGGVTSADTAGFPVDITVPGHYRLTGDLEPPDNITAIQVAANGVTLDLNGFSIRCPLGSIGMGIKDAAASRNLTVRNGILSGCLSGLQAAFSGTYGVTLESVRVVGSSSFGIFCRQPCVMRGISSIEGGSSGIVCSTGDSRNACVIERAVVRENGGAGIVCPDNCAISESVVSENEDGGISTGDRSRVVGNTVVDNTEGNEPSGIRAGTHSTILDNTVTGNGHHGVIVGDGSTVARNSLSGNVLDGVNAGQGCSIVGNAAHNNGDDGISAFSSVVRNNSTYENGDEGITVGPGSTVSDNTAFTNGGDGIQVQNGSTVQRNTMRDNTGFGLRFFSAPGASYRENTITNNTAGTVTGSGIDMGANSCNGATTCP